MPLKIGAKIFPNNIIQGPLAGYSTAPFRMLIWRYSQPAFSCTEMISSKALIHQPKQSLQRYIKKDPHEGPVCFQLSGNDPAELAQAAKIVTDHGADLIDLNCGCPVKKIRRKALGSSLLTNPTLLYQLIVALKSNTHLPVSIKIRVEGHSLDKTNREVAKVVNDAGADFLIVHGRHWSEGYDTACRYEEIKFFVDALKIPVIGNGDIASKESLQKMQATGCAGVMIARAGVGQPWLHRQLIEPGSISVPSLPEIRAIFFEHVELLASLLGNDKFALIQARKLIKYYARSIHNKIDLIARFNNCERLLDMRKICNDYFCG